LFGGRALPEGYDLETDALLDKEALLVVETVSKDGQERNRVAQLLPIRAAARPATVPAAPATRPGPVPAARQPVKVNVGAIPEPGDLPPWLAGEEDGGGDVSF